MCIRDRTVSLKNPFDLLRLARLGQAVALREFGDDVHPDRDTLPVGVGGVVEDFFDRMAESVPEVEQHPLAVVKLILFDHPPFDVDAFIDDLVENLFKRPLGELVKQGARFDCAVFDCLGDPVVPDFGGQRRESIGIAEHQSGLVERADKVFSAFNVDVYKRQIERRAIPLLLGI